MLETIIYTILYLILVISLITRYIVDNRKGEADVRSRVSKYNETFNDYVEDVFLTHIFFIFLVFLIIHAVCFFMNNYNDELALIGLIYLGLWVQTLPLSKKSYLSWLKEAPMRKQIEVKYIEAEKRRAEEKAEEKAEEEKRKLLISDLLKNIIQYEDDYFIKKMEESKFHPDKKLYIKPDTYFIVDAKSKLFTTIYYKKLKKDDIKQMLKALSLKELETTTKESFAPMCYKYKLLDDIYTFKDLLKVQIVDKTKVERTFTMEGKTTDSLLGAFLGDAFLGGINAGTIGAIAGASGERTITENSTTSIAYDILLYLNKLNNNIYTIRVEKEHKLTTFVGVLEYILHNK